ncbi:hypothetical protein [Nitrosospira sp. Nsp2]|nr:hypothetical protein [Nitrosospira sp. Nsp2]
MKERPIPSFFFRLVEIGRWAAVGFIIPPLRDGRWLTLHAQE